VVQRTDAGTDLIRLAWPDVGAAEAEAVAEVLESGQLTMGPKVEEFERGLAAACGTEHAVVVSSGTAALHLAVLALGIGPGDEVLEDAAGALGAKRHGRSCGSLGALACLSFHPRKIVTTGEGGAVTTDDAELADAIRRMRHHGIEPRGGFEIAHAGLNYRLSDILCAVGIPQLARLGELFEARTRIAAGYTERLRDIVETPSADERDVHGWQAYVIQVDGAADKIAALREQGIEAQVGTYALHRLAAYRDQGEFPGASRVFERAVALPFHTRLSESDLDRVAEALTSLVSK